MPHDDPAGPQHHEGALRIVRDQLVTVSFVNEYKIDAAVIWGIVERPAVPLELGDPALARTAAKETSLKVALVYGADGTPKLQIVRVACRRIEIESEHLLYIRSEREMIGRPAEVRAELEDPARVRWRAIAQTYSMST